MNKSELTKLIITGLGSILVTMIIMSVTLVQTFMTEEKTKIMIDTRSPYTKDKQTLLRNVRVTETLVEQVGKSTLELVKSQSDILRKLDTLVAILEDTRGRVLYLERKNTSSSFDITKKK